MARSFKIATLKKSRWRPVLYTLAILFCLWICLVYIFMWRSCLYFASSSASDLKSRFSNSWHRLWPLLGYMSFVQLTHVPFLVQDGDLRYFLSRWCYIIMSQSWEPKIRHRDFVVRLLQWLGFLLNMEKSDILKFLGHTNFALQSCFSAIYKAPLHAFRCCVNWQRRHRWSLVDGYSFLSLQNIWGPHPPWSQYVQMPPGWEGRGGLGT